MYMERYVYGMTITYTHVLQYPTMTLKTRWTAVSSRPPPRLQGSSQPHPVPQEDHAARWRPQKSALSAPARMVSL